MPTVKIFYAYSQKDRSLRDELETHLGNRSYIEHWYDREIMPGEMWENKIDEKLNDAHIILLLISPDFLYSHYCFHIEMKRALERHAKGEAHVIPIILRPTHWQDQPFCELQVLPTDGKPVTSQKYWANPDEAFYDVAGGVHRVITRFLIKQYVTAAKTYFDDGSYTAALNECEQAIGLNRPTARLDNDPTIYGAIYKVQGDALQKLERFAEALTAYDTAISLAPENTRLYIDKGDVLVNLSRFEDALRAYNRAASSIHDEPLLDMRRGDVLHRMKRLEEALAFYSNALRFQQHNVDLHKNIGDILQKLERFEEALIAYNKAIDLDPQNIAFYLEKAKIFRKIGRYDQLVETYNKILYINPDDAQIWRSKGTALENLRKYTEAVQAYEEAIHLEANNPFFYKEKGDALSKLGRLEEALAAFEEAVRLKSDYGLAYASMSDVLNKLAEKMKKRAAWAAHQAQRFKR